MLMAATQFLCFGDYMLYRGVNSYNINSCDTIEIFYNIRTDLDKLKYATHITKIIRQFRFRFKPFEHFVQVLYNGFYFINKR